MYRPSGLDLPFQFHTFWLWQKWVYQSGQRHIGLTNPPFQFFPKRKLQSPVNPISWVEWVIEYAIFPRASWAMEGMTETKFGTRVA